MAQSDLPHSESDPSREIGEDEPKKSKSRRPANTAFRQQRLKAWQPILTPKTVLPLLFAVGVIFAPIGGLLIYASAKVEELSIDYTECTNPASAPQINDFSRNNLSSAYPGLKDIPQDKFQSTFKTTSKLNPQWGFARADIEYRNNSKPVTESVCILHFNIPNNIGPPVLFYYRLTNFYQNHRRYVKSMDTQQLEGKARTVDEIRGGDCDPLKLSDTNPAKPYYPCGLVANSMFNDTFDTPIRLGGPLGVEYAWTDKGIAWSSDKSIYKKSAYKNEDVLPPLNWQKQFPDGYNDKTPIPNIEEWEAFHVWMRTAGLPTFSKLSHRNDNEAMQEGTYRMVIWDAFPVSKYGGTKSILITTRTVMGGKNPFLGIAYVVVGGLCIVLGALFTATHLIKPRKLGDHRYLTWNNDQPSTATATGRSTRPGE